MAQPFNGRVVVTRVQRSPGFISLTAQFVAQSPATNWRGVSADQSRDVDMTRPYEGVGADLTLTLKDGVTKNYGQLKHSVQATTLCLENFECILIHVRSRLELYSMCKLYRTRLMALPSSIGMRSRPSYRLLPSSNSKPNPNPHAGCQPHASNCDDS